MKDSIKPNWQECIADECEEGASRLLMAIRGRLVSLDNAEILDGDNDEIPSPKYEALQHAEKAVELALYMIGVSFR